MKMQLKDQNGDDVFVRTFHFKEGGVEFECQYSNGWGTGTEADFITVRKRDIPVLIIFLQNALKELESGNNNS